MARSAPLVLFLSIAGCASGDPLPPEVTAFRFEGRPIHPAIIGEFIPWQSDGEPVVLSVDLEGFTRSRNRLCGWDVQEKEGHVEGVRGEYGGYLWYWHLGQGRNGVHYVEVLESGGSASWRYLLELRFEVVEAFKSHRIVLRCENVETLGCCPVHLVNGEIAYGPCARHPQPIPAVEPADVSLTGPALSDPSWLRLWDPLSRNHDSLLGRLRVFGRSIFFERAGLVLFEVIAESKGRCLLRLSREVESCRFLRLGMDKDLEVGSELDVAFYQSIEDARPDDDLGSKSAQSWGVYVRSNE